MSDGRHRFVFDIFTRYNGCPKCGGDIRIDDRDRLNKLLHIYCFNCKFIGWVNEKDTRK